MKYLLLPLAFLAISCQKQIEIDLNETQDKLVVNSLLTEGDNIEVDISKSCSILDTDYELNSSLEVQLFENENFVGNLENTEHEIYTLQYPLAEEKSYKLIVQNSDYGQVIATDTIPKCTEILDATITIPVGFNEDGSPYSEVSLIFSDDLSQDNFYEVCLYGIYSDERKEYFTEVTSNDPVIINEGNMDYYQTSLFFSDKLFNGDTINLSMKFVGVSKPEVLEYGTKVFVTLRSVSRSYYLYRKFWTRHTFNQTLTEDLLGMFFKGEPIEMYTNVENGYGIFAAYTEDTKKLQFIESK